MAGVNRMTRMAALAVLGLPEQATAREITRAYRRLAKSTHPDLVGQPGVHHDPEPSDAGIRFAALADAYRALTSAAASPPPAAAPPPPPAAAPPRHGWTPVAVRFTGLPTPAAAPAPIVAGPVRISPATTRRRST
jgi:DnaJ domain